MASAAALGHVARRGVWRAWRIAPLAPVAIALLPVLLAVPFLNEPMLKDEGVYFTVAMYDGLPYTEVFDHKPPAIFGWYKLSLLLSGGDASVTAVHLLAALQLSATALGVSWIGWQIGGRKLGIASGLIAAASTANQYLQFNANTEVFLLPPLTFALGAWIAGIRQQRLAWMLIAGVLSGVAIMTKSVALLNLVALAGVTVWAAAVGERSAVFAVRAFVFLLGGCVVTLAATAAPWVVTGQWSEFWYANVTYNIAYGRETSPLAQFWSITEWDSRVLAGGLVVWVLAGIGAVRVASRDTSPMHAAVLASAVAAFAGASLTGRELAHYWAPLLPPAAILAAIALLELTAGWEMTRKRLHAEALLLALAVPSIIACTQLYMVDAEEAHLVKNRHALESRWENESGELAAYIASVSEPGDEIFVFGLEAQLYALADRRPAAYFNRPLAALRVDPQSFGRTMTELGADPPAVFVDTARTVVAASVSTDESTTGTVVDVDPERRRQIDAFLAAGYEFARRVAYADVYIRRDH